MADTNQTQFELHLLDRLLHPSYLSGTISVLATVAILGSAIIAKLYWSGGWLSDVLQTIASADGQLAWPVSDSGDSPLNVLLLFVFWSCVGLMVYFVVIGLARAAADAHELQQEMGYVHGNRVAILKQFAGRLMTRLIGLTLLLTVVTVFVQIVLPYAFMVARAASLSLDSLVGLLLAAIILLGVLHIMAVLLRLVALRPRLFSDEV